MINHREKKHGVTPRTRKRNVRAFAAKRNALSGDLGEFVNGHCKSRSLAAKARFLHELVELIDRWVDYNFEVNIWCRKNGVDAREFVRDVMNEERS